VVPVHSMLIRLGILEHLTMVKKAGSVRLFPELRPDSRGHFSRFPSRWFGRYLRRVKIKDSREINFHSFRHTAADAFRSGHVSNDQFAPLFGHARATMTGRYGIEAEGTIEQRVAMIEAISYDLDLSHLMPVGAPAAA
jgi:integrase